MKATIILRMPRYGEGSWAPVVLETFFHIYSLATPLRRAPAVTNSVTCLLEGRLIKVDPHSFTGYRLTKRGRKHMSNLLGMEYPK
jgi:hypothetical protein